ncbi:sugar ABC transporter permease [Paenibacillus sp. IB182496]|uniref:Sugar ABC transporter permease n=1 Tax=Paenibacillus sabuli TaxID=2772509 RepID=A0A927BXJ5_9BACL|nr:ABC transporter permease subunit [Paenibacillus sabuli]MBD2847178.1 sugar ABC transporter permease [Paenibacillus sabuli]
MCTLKAFQKKIGVNWQLYLLFLPTLAYFLIFQYGPLYGIQIAFKDFSAVRGITGSPWIGFEHFERFFGSYQFWTLLYNTIELSLYGLLVGFPVPIILALLLNQLGHERFKRFVQTVSYAPHFISTVVLVGMMFVFLSPNSGLLNQIIVAFGGDPVFFMARPEWFKTLFVFSTVWQSAGWGAIIYLAALASIDPGLHEAARIDGASKLQRIRHIDLPGIMPTIIILFILEIGKLMTVGFEKAYLMQNSLNIDSSEIIQTYVYKTGLLGAQFSFSTAVGLFDAVINFMILILFNRLSRRISETSLW